MFRHPSTPKRRSQGLSPALAPASGSALQRDLPGEPGRSLLYRSVPTLNRQFRGRIPQAGPSSGYASSGPKTFRNAPIGRQPGNPARDATPTHFLQCRPCFRPKPSPGVPPDVRGQVPPRHPSLKFSRSIRPLGFQVRKGFAPFRCPEGASAEAIRQAGKHPVFHFPQISLWTRVDKSPFRRKHRKRNYLSRFANKRSRRALSLMKPSASVWS